MKYNRLHHIYIDILCITFAVVVAFLPTSGFAAESDEYSAQQMQLVHVIPAQIDEQTVYPTRHAVIELDPLTAYRWEYIEVPQEWIGDDYYFELWGADNRPLPGFTARKLHQHMDGVNGNRILIDALDATLYPAVRLVLFRQNPDAAITEAQEPVRIYYSAQPNKRLFMFAATLVAIIGSVLVGMWGADVSLQQTVRQSLPFISGRLEAEGYSINAFVRYTVLTIVWASVFGAALGVYVGGIQIVYLLIKLPFLLIITFIFSFVSIAVLSQLVGIQSRVNELAVQALRILAAFSIGLAALSPLVLFYIYIDYNHDQLLSAFMLMIAVSAIVAALQLWSWIKSRAPGIQGATIVAIWLAVYGVVLMQFGWMLRPWVGETDPIHNSVPFARLYSGNVFEEISNTLNRL